jgi:hypothetical protein
VLALCSYLRASVVSSQRVLMLTLGILGLESMPMMGFVIFFQ